ncbi:MAG TPA: 3'(2'),5'-bisphosphate nucleotidase CysQ [Xanthobacteraceae bacterium]|nr:3'(2'),5'-bisphosphate nucleotidase CysQ [Xanthobacteraceae bacterium]
MPVNDPQAIDLATLSEHLVSAVREAGALAFAMSKGPLKSWSKHHGSPVSEADIEVDRMLHDRLTPIVPDYGWLSEEREDTKDRLSARRTWIVDPIDGTRAYLAGRPDWTIAVALVERGRPVLAAVFAPVEQAMFAAVADQGATLNGSSIAASTGDELQHTRIAGPKRHMDRLTQLIPGINGVPKIHSLALRFARIAEGTLDAAFASGSSSDWDLAAADLLVHEAGGALTTLDGRSLVYNRPHPTHGALVAAGRPRHKALVTLLRGHQGTLL